VPTSTPRLSEVARHLVYPDGIVKTNFPRIKARLAEMAIEYDGWQEGAATLILGLDERGRYTATIGGVTMSLPRQVGKTFTVGSLLVAMCLEFPGLRVVWTSHHLRTTTNTFRSMQAMVRRKKIFPRLAPNGIRTANGEQEIRFANGSMIMFGAREHGFGVGIDAIDVLVCDEAQRLSSRALADMMPTTNQARHPHGALVFFIGTPPRPDDKGDEFAARRSKAIDGRMKNGIYIELSADDGAELDDPAQWAKANPSYPHRTPHESMLRMRENLNDEGDWSREALGRWDDPNTVSDLIIPSWPQAATRQAPPPPACLGLAMDLDRVWLSLAACSTGNVPHLGSVMRVRVDIGRDQLLNEAARIVRERKVRLIVDSKDAGANLEDALSALGVSVGNKNMLRVSFDDYVQACGDVYDAIEAKEAEHGDYTDLNTAVANARWSIGKRRVWAPDGGDVSMLKASTLAWWGAKFGSKRGSLTRVTGRTSAY
jgi:hypothetical protein